MAIIKCPECGKSFSDKAAACPECGCPIEYAVKEADRIVAEQKEKNDEVYRSHSSTIELYQATLEQEWEKYLDYNEKNCKFHAETRAASERIADLQINEEIAKEENVISKLQQKRAALGIFAFNEKKALDAEIPQHISQIEKIRETRKEKISKAGGRLWFGEPDEAIFQQYAADAEPVLHLRKEYEEAKKLLMFPAEYKWDLSRLERMTKSDFEEGFRVRFVALILRQCIDELGSVNLKEFALHTGFPEEEVLGVEVRRKSRVDIETDKETGEKWLVPEKSSYYFSTTARTSGGEYEHRSGSRAPDFSHLGKKEKSASVLGRAAVGAALAGPVGALVGALSAADKNNRRR